MGKPTISIGFGPLKRVLVQLGMLVYQRGICIEHEGLLSRKVSRRSRMSWTSWTSLCDRHAMNINQDHPEKLPLWESSQHRSQNLLLNFKEKLNRLWLCHICIFLLYIYTYSIWITHIVYICICIYIYNIYEAPASWNRWKLFFVSENSWPARSMNTTTRWRLRSKWRDEPPTKRRCGETFCG